MRLLKYILPALAVFGLAVWLFFGFGGKRAMPAFGSKITEPGRYRLDDRRTIIIENRGGALKYIEETSEAPEEKSILPQVVGYGRHEVSGISLSPGWSIVVRPPDVLVIDTGNGETIERKFGEVAEPRIESSSVTRKAAPGSAEQR